MKKRHSNLLSTVVGYFDNIFKRPKAPLTTKQFRATYWGKIFSIPNIAILWFFGKIHPSIEIAIARKLSEKWFFKPIPMPDALSIKALKYKNQITIEINEETDVETKILDVTTFNELIEKFPFAEIRDCGCRSIIKHCDCPTHTCLRLKWAVDISKEIPDNTENQIATKEEIQRVLDLSDKYSLIHMTLHRPDKDHIYVLCNCCDCCCVGLRTFKERAVPLLVGSKYVAKVDKEKCIGCYRCVNYRCRFGAILIVNEDKTTIDPRKEDQKRFKFRHPRWSEDRRGWGTRIRPDPPNWEKIKKEHTGKWYARVNPYRCFGCGLCASEKYGCPEKAIKLYPREKLYKII